MDDESDYKRFRRRIEWETKLLDTRTTLFLLGNAVAANAIASEYPSIRLGVIIPAIGVSVIWLVVSWRSTKIVYALKDDQGQIPGGVGVDARIEKIVRSQSDSKWLTNTRLIGQWLPAFILLCWALALVIHLTMIFARPAGSLPPVTHIHNHTHTYSTGKPSQVLTELPSDKESDQSSVP